MSTEGVRHRLQDIGLSRPDSASPSAPTQGSSQAPIQMTRRYRVYPSGRRHSAERVRARNSREARRAERMMRELEREYGIRVSSSAGQRSMRRLFPRFRTSRRAWSMSELRAMLEAAHNYRHTLGWRRRHARRHRIRSSRQNVRTISALDMGPDDDDVTPDPSTRAETFRSEGNISFFSANTRQDTRNVRRVANHEMAHSELQPHFLSEFERQRPTWRTRSGRVEQEPSSYAATNSREDFAETFGHTLIGSQRMNNRHRNRRRFARRILGSL